MPRDFVANRYANVEARLEAQKREVRERQMREWLAEIEAYPGEGFCYFIGSDEGIIKIGHSRQPGQRLTQLRRETVYKLNILARVRGDRSRERYYHHLFAAHRVRGEWFARHPDILAEIERLRMPGNA